MARARQRHVQKAQVFTLAFAVGLRQRSAIRLQVQRVLATFVRQVQERGAPARDGAHAAGKGQAHQRVFQALGFVYGHHLDQVGVAFQPHGVGVAGGAAAFELLRQPAQQGMFAIELRAGLLQQFGQVQKVGQAAFAARLLQPARGQPQLVQALAQHGQHALGAPDGLQGAQLRGACVQRVLVVRQLLQLGQRQADGAGGQAGAHAACVQRRGHGVQPVQQVTRLGAGKHRVAVGQVHRGHAAPAQFAPHGSGFLSVAHQHRDVGWAQALARLAGRFKPGQRVVQPGGNALGAERGKQAPVLVVVAQFQVVLQHQGGRRALRGVKSLGTATRLHRHEGQRVGLPGAAPEQKGAAPRPQLGLRKAVVDRVHQRLRGAVVGAQHIVAPGSGPARCQVAVDVGAAKTVDRLLGVANQEQRGVCGVVGRAVQPVKDAVLQRRGVLEFVHQRHRVLRGHARAQAFALRPGQGAVQARQHVGKTKAAAVRLELCHARLHLRCRMQAQRLGRLRQGAQRRQQVRQRLEVCGQRDRRRAGLARFQQAVGAQAVLGRRGEFKGVQSRALCPGAHLPKPLGVMGRLEFGAVPVAHLGRGLGVQPLLHGLCPVGPAHLERCHGRAAGVHGAGDAFGQRAVASAGGQRGLGQLAHFFHQRVHVFPEAQHGVDTFCIQWIALLAPVVLGGFGLHGALVGVQFLVKQAAAVKGVLAQHALAPGVDGVDGGIVHAFGRHGQAPGGVLAGVALRVRGQQSGQKGVVRRHLGRAAKALRRLQQARADAVGQLARGSAREGHHQNVGRPERLRKGVAIPMAQHQPQVQRGNRPGFAGAGAGLDQAAAPERKGQRLERVAGVGVPGQRPQGGWQCRHAVSTFAGSAAASVAGTCTVARTWPDAHRASGAQTSCASASMRSSALSASKSG